MANRRGRDEEDRIAEAAAGWVARLQSRDATPQDHRAFQAWVARDPAHQAAYDGFKDLWTDLKEIPIPSDRLNKLRRSRRTAITSIAGFGIVVMLSAVLYRAGIVERLRADYATAVGEVRSVTLADGTKVDMNTDTAIAVRFSAGERRILLLRGEAYFDVGRDPVRPFIVDDGTLSARDIGTRYSMRTAAGSFQGDVRVEDGHVEVTGARSQVTLGPGDVATLADGGRLSVATADIASGTAWRGGKLVFSGRPLGEVLQTLERYRNGRIVVLDQAAANQAVSGIFDLRDTDQALRALEENLPVTVTRLTSLMVVVRSR